MARILLVEDDKLIVEALSELLASEGHEVDDSPTQDGAVALACAPHAGYALALVDVTLAQGNGFAVCAAIKAATPQVPVIFLTASGDELNTVTGLSMGADDYVAKPFRPRELVSRIRSVLRRAGRSQSVLTIGAVRVDTDRASVTKNGQELFLSALEYRLLLAFLNHRGQTLSRAKLLEEIWDVAGDFVNDNTLTVYIKRLREKLGDDAQEPTMIRTVRGVGYRLEEPPC